MKKSPAFVPGFLFGNGEAVKRGKDTVSVKAVFLEHEVHEVTQCQTGSGRGKERFP
jgi:hypothetical protein